MKAKYVVGLLTAIVFSTAGLSLAQEPTPPPTPPEDLNTFSFFVDGGGFLGVYGEDINRENMGRYRLSEPRGVGITQVVQDSPAAKAGLRKDDVILRLDGENVTSVRKLNRLVSEIAPDHSVRITISRNGAEQEISATIGKRNTSSTVRDLMSQQPKVWKWEGPLFGKDKFPDANENDLTFFFGNSRRIGVNTVELTKQLADYFGIPGGRGVLVTSVSEDGPAAKAGIKAGDVITAVDGEAIDSPGDISSVINRKKEGDVTLTVIRNRTQQTIRVTPRQGSSLSRTIRDDMARSIKGSIRDSIRDQVGRQIVIPRIEFPEINISLPRVRINPGLIRISRRVYGPI
ncbi:MAG TPA: PDZ domain-containing protein [Pyrinomonadaceae bacterium]|nr:PDZ domain-containing protein [Pyrinomonadaceae bacterium]